MSGDLDGGAEIDWVRQENVNLRASLQGVRDDLRTMISVHDEAVEGLQQDINALTARLAVAEAQRDALLHTVRVVLGGGQRSLLRDVMERIASPDVTP